jgi:hypothetical protein
MPGIRTAKIIKLKGIERTGEIALRGSSVTALVDPVCFEFELSKYRWILGRGRRRRRCQKRRYPK